MNLIEQKVESAEFKKLFDDLKQTVDYNQRHQALNIEHNNKLRREIQETVANHTELVHDCVDRVETKMSKVDGKALWANFSKICFALCIVYMGCERNNSWTNLGEIIDLMMSYKTF